MPNFNNSDYSSMCLYFLYCNFMLECEFFCKGFKIGFKITATATQRYLLLCTHFVLDKEKNLA